ncbi:M61 family metallopeptidase [Desertivirga arenae]|uniref:M61 family metallopeptidase n=1 Tax=Desertivirga arenae TaxID=2810309 RepID=UPI001F6019DA|nr:PDZ domain-containing protein [Pedobacter sp. SYSU D00823]
MSLTLDESTAATKINFEVSFSEPQAHYIDVEMSIADLGRDFVDIKMPVWAPGSYLVREFAKNVEGFSAADSKGNTLGFKKTNKNTWRVSLNNKSEIKVNYRVYAFELSVRTSFVDASHAFLSPTGVFMYVDGMIKEPSTVKIRLAKNWAKVSTGLEPVKGKENTFLAPDFDILYDSPLEVGNQDVFEFTAAGVRHEVAMYGGGNYDKARLSADMAKIVETETAVFGENPNKHYVFIVHNTSTGGGGLEHLNSTVLGARRLSYADEAGYKGFLGLVAHEYFHLWNVKRLRPQALGPFNYDQENYTTDLWISEGFTAYYDNLMLRRAGLYTPEKYLDVVNADINTVENQPGNRVQPVSEASFDAWIKYYRPHENSRNSTISYYDKGAVLAMVLDLEILGSTKGKKGLDDVMKAMYDEYYKKQKRGFTDAEFRAMAEKVAGKSLDKIYNDYVNGTQPISFNNYLGHAGLALVDDNKGRVQPFLGAATVIKDGKVTVTAVARGSSAWNYGLNVNDEIIAIDNNRITLAVDPNTKISDLDRSVVTKKVGEKIQVLISRDGLIQTLDIQLSANNSFRYRIAESEDVTEDQMLVRRRWLHL